MPASQSCDSPTPEARTPRAPRHPAPWRQIEATLYERQTCSTLPDPVETAGSQLVDAPSTPTSTRSHDPTFAEKLHRSLELATLRQEVRRGLYGTAAADEIRPGYTPPSLREEKRLAAFDGYESDSSTSSERSSTAASADTPQSCDMPPHVASGQPVAAGIQKQVTMSPRKQLGVTSPSPFLPNLDVNSPEAAAVLKSKKRKRDEMGIHLSAPSNDTTTGKRRRRLGTVASSEPQQIPH